MLKQEQETIIGIIKQLKVFTIPAVAEEEIRNSISSIKNNDKNTNNVLDHDEAISALSEIQHRQTQNLALHAEEKEKTIQEGLAHVCETAGENSQKGRAIKATLEKQGGNFLNALLFYQAVAKSVDNSTDSDLDKAITYYASYKGKQLMQMIPEDILSQEGKEALQQGAEDTYKEIAKKYADIIQKNPDIKQGLLSIPDPSEIGNLNANDICTVTTGKPIGRSL